MDDALIATVAVTAVGAVQARELQEQVMGLIVTAIVDVVLGPLHDAKVVVIVKVSETVDAIWLPYTEGSIVKVFEPDVTVESVIVAHVVTLLLELSVIA